MDNEWTGKSVCSDLLCGSHARLINRLVPQTDHAADVYPSRASMLHITTYNMQLEILRWRELPKYKCNTVHHDVHDLYVWHTLDLHCT